MGGRQRSEPRQWLGACSVCSCVWVLVLYIVVLHRIGRYLYFLHTVSADTPSSLSAPAARYVFIYLFIYLFVGVSMLCRVE